MVYGHRGARAEAPENTLVGFAYARSVGLEAVEFDVRMTRDRELVVIHDATVDRTTDGQGAVAELTLAQVRALDARAGFDAGPACQVPTLDEVLAAVGDLAAIEIEIKRDTAGRTPLVVESVLNTLATRAVAAQTVLASFHLDVLEQLRQSAPEMTTGYIGRWDNTEFVNNAVSAGASRANLQHTTSSADVADTARSAGLAVLGWPCNSKQEWELLAGWAVVGVTTDVPSLVLAL